MILFLNEEDCSEGSKLRVLKRSIVCSMSDPEEAGGVIADGANIDQYHIGAVLGELEEVRYFVSDEDHLYAVAVENVHRLQMILVYEVEPVVSLLWVFRSVDPAIWGSAMWTNNENVVGAAESVRESEQAVLVTEEFSGHRVLKFLTFDVDEGDWRVFLVLSSVPDDDVSVGASDEGSSFSQVSSPCLSDEADSHQ